MDTVDKFQDRIAQLQIASSVAGTVQYYIDDKTESANNYREIAEEKEDKVYWTMQANQYDREAAIWKELMAYLEKQYLK